MTPAQLPANKGYAFRRAFATPAQIVPGRGSWVVEVQESKSANFSWATVSRYLVIEDDCPAGGRLFQVWKKLSIVGAESYWTRIKPGETSCDCTGFLQHGHCKHAESLSSLAARGDLNEAARVANTNRT